MLLNAVIIEDERKGLLNLKHMLAQHCDGVEVIGEADGIDTGLELFNREGITPDVAFLDINIKGGKVFQLLDQLDSVNFDVIFVTAYDQFAIKACEYSSIGYILKPIDADKLVEAVGRVRPANQARTQERIQVMKQYASHPNSFEKMSIAALDGIHFVKIRDIVRFEAEDNYTHIHLADGSKITASKTIKSYEDMLTPFNFYRVHKRHVINMNYMKRFVKGEGGYLVMEDDERIEVSRRRRPAFMTQLRTLQDVL